MNIAKAYSRAAAIKYRASYFRRMRYWRGHGIHSPFVYNMVRKIFMTSEVLDPNILLSENILARKIATRKTAIQIQNLYGYCGYSSFEVLDSKAEYQGSEMVVIDKSCSQDQISQIINHLRNQEHRAIVIIAPHSSEQRHKMCKMLSDNHKGISIDKFNMLILLFDNRYLKQHYKI